MAQLERHDWVQYSPEHSLIKQVESLVRMDSNVVRRPQRVDDKSMVGIRDESN